MKMKLILLSAIMACGSFFYGCSDDDATTPTTKTPGAPSFIGNTQIVKIPTTIQNSTNPNVALIAGSLSMVNSMAGYGAMFIIPANANSMSSELKTTSPQTYTWSNGEFTVSYEYYDLSDKYTWTIYYTIAPQPKYKAFYAEENKDGKSGKMEVYNETSGVKEVSWNWNKNDANNVTFVYESFDTPTEKLTVVSNADGSGSIKFVEGTVTKYEALWDASGKGSYTIYDQPNVTGTF
jgi:hypothetical protein